MTTTYYISWQVKKSNRTRAWYASKEFTTEAEARAKYDAKRMDGKVITLYLWKKESYRPDELANWAHPYNFDKFDTLATFAK